MNNAEENKPEEKRKYIKRKENIFVKKRLISRNQDKAERKINKFLAKYIQEKTSLSSYRSIAITKIFLEALREAILKHDEVFLQNIGIIRRLRRQRKAKILTAETYKKIRNKELTRKQALDIQEFTLQKYLQLLFEMYEPFKKELKSLDSHTNKKHK